jgi:hypothetical protein
MAKAGQRKCMSCGEFFIPNHRSGDRQRYCCAADCRRASKAASQAAWLARPPNNDYFSGPVHVARVQAWRAAHPGYSRGRVRPSPDDCREMKPSALSWGVPTEDGAMFNGLYLDAMCSRWLVTKDEEARVKACRLVAGLLKLSSVGETPGFIARGLWRAHRCGLGVRCGDFPTSADRSSGCLVVGERRGGESGHDSHSAR